MLALALVIGAVLSFACARNFARICAWWTRSTQGLRGANSRLQVGVSRLLQEEVRVPKERAERDNIIRCKNTSDLDDYRGTVKDFREQAASRKQQISDLEKELQIARSM